MQISRFRRTVATVAAATVALGGLALGALPANAAPTIPDANAVAELIIHKFEYTGTDGVRGNGLETDTSGLVPMEDIEFQVQQVPGFDLSTNAGWQAAGSLTPGAAQTAVDGAAVTPIALTTDAAGIATFANLPIGLYLVTENLTPAQIAAGITAIDNPFLVTLPLTHPTNLDEWLYEVHVYPKNRITDAPVKTVSDNTGTTLAVGDEIDWTITTPIPVGTLSAFGIRDVFVEWLEHTDTVVSVTAGSIALDAGDYTVEAATAANDNTVKIKFTAAGLTKLTQIKAAEETAQVQVVLTTEVLDLPANGVLVNQAASFPNNTYDIDNPDDPGVPSNEVKSKFGNLNITKQDQAGALLSGAEFQVFATKADALAGTPAISIDGQSTWTTVNGLVSIEGLRASNWADGVLLTNSADFQTYWLVETKAPNGFELLAEPVEFTVLADATDELALGATTIINVPENGGFDLPLTGGAGTALFMIVGLGLVGVAGVVLMRSRKTSAV